MTELAIKENLFYALSCESKDEKEVILEVEEVAKNFKQVYTSIKTPKIGEAPLYRYKYKFCEYQQPSRSYFNPNPLEMWSESKIEKYEDGEWKLFMKYIDNDKECINLCNRLLREGNIVLKN